MSHFTENISWNILGNAGGKILTPLFQLLIARLLLPEHFGLFAVSIAWLAVYEIGKDLGLSQAIIVGRGGPDSEELQFSVQFAIATAFMLITLAGGGPVERYFGEPQLREILTIVSLVAFISAAADPVVTRCLKDQDYKLLAIRQLVTPVASGAVGLTLAALGYGAHALALGLIAGHVAGLIALLSVSRRHLRLRFNGPLLRTLMPLGSHIVIQRLFGFLVGQADSLIVGRALGPAALGNYRMSNTLAFMAPGASVGQAEQVLFTELSSNRSPGHLQSRYDLFTHTAGPLLLAYSVLMYLAAPELVPLLLGAQWTQAVPFIQLFSLVVVTGFLTPLNIDLAKILGFASVYTRYAACRSVVTVLAIYAASAYSTTHIVVTWVAAGFAFNLINDIVFYRSQSVVRPTRGKVAIVFAAWVWAAFAMSQILS